LTLVRTVGKLCRLRTWVFIYEWGATLKLRGRIALCLVAIVILSGQLTAVARGTTEPRLTEALTQSEPADGGDIRVDTVEGLPTGPGEALVEPGTENEESFSYTDIGTDPPRFIGVTRPSPGDHAEGAIVRGSVETPSPSPSASGSSSPSPQSGTSQGDAQVQTVPTDEPDETTTSTAPDSETPSDATSGSTTDEVSPLTSGNAGPQPDAARVSDAGEDASAIPDPCTLVEEQTHSEVCNIALVTVVARVEFDDVYGLPAAPASCGWAGFNAYDADGDRVTNHPTYIATATTVASLSAPQTWQGTLDDSGRAVLYYCPPPTIVTGPVEVTFTATVQGVTGVAERTWAVNAQPELPPMETTFMDQDIPPSPVDGLLGDTLIAVGGNPVGLESSPTDYPRNHSCYGYRTTYAKGARGQGDQAYYGVDTQLGAHAMTEAHSGGATITRRHSTAWALAGAGWKWYGSTANAYMSLPWNVLGSMATSTQDIPFQSSSASALTEVYTGVRDNTTGQTIVEERVANWSQQGESFRDRASQGSKRYYFLAEHLHTYSGFIRVETTSESDTPTPYLSSSSINDFFSQNRRAWLTYVALTIPDRVIRCG
jgi:hypothetical protein